MHGLMSIKNVEFRFQNKFEKLVYLFGFIIRKIVTMHGHICHYARSHELIILSSCFLFISSLSSSLSVSPKVL
jgi:hypothetical protein